MDAFTKFIQRIVHDEIIFFPVIGLHSRCLNDTDTLFTRIRRRSCQRKSTSSLLRYKLTRGVSPRLRITIFNPNIYPLTNAAFTNNLADGALRSRPGKRLSYLQAAGRPSFTPAHLATPRSHFPNGDCPGHRPRYPGQCYVERAPSPRLQRATMINSIQRIGPPH